MFSLDSKLTLTIFGFIIATLVGSLIYYQSNTIKNYKLKLENSATTAEVVKAAHATASFEQKQQIIFKDAKKTRKEVANEKSIRNLTDGNYTISF